MTPKQEPSTAGGALPTFLIVGAMKAGTTSLAGWLRDHPRVFMPGEKELHFFDVWHEKGVDWYRGQFTGGERAAARGEATPGYMFWPESVDRMAAVVPDARLIAVLRHPVDRAWSHYCHLHQAGKEDRDFRQLVTLEAEADPEQGRQWIGYLARGRYLEQLVRITGRYPRHALLVLLLDDLEQDPAETYARVCRFIGVDDGLVPRVVGTNINPRARPRSVTLERVLDGPVGRAAPPRVLAAVRRRNRVVTPNVDLDPDLRRMLIGYFEPHNAALADWLGRDLTAWSS